MIEVQERDVEKPKNPIDGVKAGGASGPHQAEDHQQTSGAVAPTSSDQPQDDVSNMLSTDAFQTANKSAATDKFLNKMKLNKLMKMNTGSRGCGSG